MKRQRKSDLWLTIGGIVVVLLAAAVFTLGSLNIPLRPQQGNAFLVFFALTTVIVAALLVFSLILTRNLVRLGAERLSGQMGSRFKVKMVFGAMGVSLLPMVLLFFFSYALVNRTLNNWFPHPLEVANEQSQILLTHFETTEFDRLNRLAAEASVHGAPDVDFLARNHAIDISWVADANGRIISSSDFTKVSNVAPAVQGSARTFSAAISPESVADNPQWSARLEGEWRDLSGG